MQKTNMEYMSDPARVERTVQKFMAMTLGSLKAQQLKKRAFAEWCSEDVIRTEGLDWEKAETMNYVELICLLDHIVKDDRYMGKRGEDGTIYPSSLFRGFTIRMMQSLLLDADRKCIPIRLFLALPVKSFYDYLRRTSGNKELYTEYKNITGQYSRLGGNAEGETIKDMLKTCSSALGKAWYPMTASLETYGQNILRAYDVLEHLLMKSFKLAFPEQFCMERIRTKYRLEEEFFEDPYGTNEKGR